MEKKERREMVNEMSIEALRFFARAIVSMDAQEYPITQEDLDAALCEAVSLHED